MSSDEEEICTDLSDPSVTTKYMSAAEICNKVLQEIAGKCVAGADVYEICTQGDKLIEEHTSKQYNKKVKGEPILKGVAFPVCICVNEIAGHFSPMKEESMILNTGDLVKIDLGVHFDGFASNGAHSLIVGADVNQPVCTGRKADAILAAHTAMEAAIRTIKVGGKNADVTDMMNIAAAEFGCNMVAGALSNKVDQHELDGEEHIASRKFDIDEVTQQPVKDYEFEANEVFHLDVVVSTGDGRVRDSGQRSTVYKRDPGAQYVLKSAKARQFVKETTDKAGLMMFSLNSLPDPTVARVGVSESKRHGLYHEYPVLKEREGAFVAQFKATILLLAGGTKRVTGFTIDTSKCQGTTDGVVNEDLKKLLAGPAPGSKKAKKKAAAKKE